MQESCGVRNSVNNYVIIRARRIAKNVAKM